MVKIKKLTFQSRCLILLQRISIYKYMRVQQKDGSFTNFNRRHPLFPHCFVPLVFKVPPVVSPILLQNSISCLGFFDFVACGTTSFWDRVNHGIMCSFLISKEVTLFIFLYIFLGSDKESTLNCSSITILYSDANASST